MSVVVAGGASDRPILQTEILDPGAVEWRTGPELPRGDTFDSTTTKHPT